MKITFKLLILCVLMFSACEKELFVDFEHSSVSYKAPSTVTFLNKSESEATVFTWDFGDNTSESNERNPTHVYNNEGVYIVQLRAARTSSESRIIAEKTVTIYQ